MSGSGYGRVLAASVTPDVAGVIASAPAVLRRAELALVEARESERVAAYGYQRDKAASVVRMLESILAMPERARQAA